MKPWWKSKTIQFNALVAIMLLAEQNINSLQGLIPDSALKIMVFGLPIVNLLLRIVTTHGVTLKAAPPSADSAEQP